MRKKLRRLHVFGNGHDLFDVLKPSHALPGDGCDIIDLGFFSGLGTGVILRRCSNISTNSSFFFFNFAMMNFDFFKSGSIKNTACDYRMMNKLALE